ncbi:hypothetical protein [Chryseobacterium gregarium]|uniref:hypothetical protein n=1 Tax=Chryseobacterium gregarium TaxID=456299 RepID=UPI00041AF91C|nr:hypothetical protein [Chryseobacterium gregarium]
MRNGGNGMFRKAIFTFQSREFPALAFSSQWIVTVNKVKAIRTTSIQNKMIHYPYTAALSE